MLLMIISPTFGKGRGERPPGHPIMANGQTTDNKNV
jgi:hypothetical protein